MSLKFEPVEGKDFDKMPPCHDGFERYCNGCFDRLVDQRAALLAAAKDFIATIDTRHLGGEHSVNGLMVEVDKFRAAIAQAEARPC